MSIGDPVSHRDLIEGVLEALPEEFNAIVASVNSKSEVISLDELESHLLTQEARNEKFKKAAATEPASINLAHGVGLDNPVQGHNSEFSEGNFNSNSQYNNNNQFSDGQYAGRGHSRGKGFRGSRFRGRGGRGTGPRPCIQCQICHKPGHDASYCHFRLQP